ncbi:MAG TPA: stage II sporulation protein M [Candidatus Altiarchaeales archaeon]|mgnify:CR=1 FL=1|nr:stage II sporulation protein M [Candidatus Altiarchaeales archaeon]
MMRLRRELSGLKTYAVFALSLFFCGIILGLLSYPLIEERVGYLIELAFSGILVEEDDFATMLNVFTRNLTATLMLFLAGILILPTIAIMFTNGFIIGLVGMHARSEGVTALRMFGAVIPHGIFEVPALALSAGLGLKLGGELANPGGEKRLGKFIENVRTLSAVYILVVMPLLLIAAVVEVLVSKNLV